MPDSSKIDVVGVGLNATDTLIPVHQFPAAGSKIEFRSANVLPGGQVATAMVACQSWGLRTRKAATVSPQQQPLPLTVAQPILAVRISPSSSLRQGRVPGTGWD